MLKATFAFLTSKIIGSWPCSVVVECNAHHHVGWKSDAELSSRVNADQRRGTGGVVCLLQFFCADGKQKYPFKWLVGFHFIVWQPLAHHFNCASCNVWCVFDEIERNFRCISQHLVCWNWSWLQLWRGIYSSWRIGWRWTEWSHAAAWLEPDMSDAVSGTAVQSLQTKGVQNRCSTAEVDHADSFVMDSFCSDVKTPLFSFGAEELILVSLVTVGRMGLAVL